MNPFFHIFKLLIYAVAAVIFASCTLAFYLATILLVYSGDTTWHPLVCAGLMVGFLYLAIPCWQRWEQLSDQDVIEDSQETI